jgi:hypothetical protein
MGVAKIVQVVAFSLAAVAGTGATSGAIAPTTAPDVRTMDTMAERMDIERYQDEGRCDLWVTNMSNPSQRIEREFDCSLYWDWSLRQNGTAYVHEVLYDRAEDQVFEVPNMQRGVMQEFDEVSGHMLTEDALSFTADTHRDPGVLMPPPGANGSVAMGWVESGGERGAPQKLVVARDLQEFDTHQVEGLEVVHWNSTVDRVTTEWHGYEMVLTEHVDMLSDPKTGWVLEMTRHVRVEMTPRQMAAAFGTEVPVDQGEARPVMELTCTSKPGAIVDHAGQAQRFRQMMWPIESGDTVDNVAGASAGLFAVAVLATNTISNLAPVRDGSTG